MKNKKTYYTVSAIFWLLVGLVSYQFYILPKTKKEVEKKLINSVNEIHQLQNIGFSKYEMFKKRNYSYDIVGAYTYKRDRKVLNTIAIVKNMVDSLNMLSEIHFSDVELFYAKDYYEDEDIEMNNLKSLSMNENLYNESNLYSLLYKNTLLTTLKDRNNGRYFMIVGSCNWGRGWLVDLLLFDKNKIGFNNGAWYHSIAYSNYTKTKSTNFEFETVVEKLGRNHQTLRTRYRTTPKGEELGIYDYEVIETSVEK